MVASTIVKGLKLESALCADLKMCRFEDVPIRKCADSKSSESGSYGLAKFGLFVLSFLSNLCYVT